MFLHFGVNTFTNREWGTGEENPNIFNPVRLDARQWARVAREAGFTTLILTAKHHDGFALWPSAYTDHSVASSPWRDGTGDVVRDVSEAARSEGLKLGLYLSPWDRHEPVYGNEEAYNTYYLGQLRELMTGYGAIREVWFDGAKGEGAKNMEYDFDAFWSLVRQLQPGAVMFSDAGPDVRWIGNEHGFAGETNWSTYDRTKVGVGMPGITEYLNVGEMGAPDWVPGECDVSLRPGWFFHPDQQPKTLDELMEIYYRSVGRNCVLLLNVPPGPDGLFSRTDVERLLEFGRTIRSIYRENLASGSSASASSKRDDGAAYGAGSALDGSLETYWAPVEGDLAGTLEFELDSDKAFDVVMIQEPIQLGQRISSYRVDAFVGASWETIARGTTVGHKKLDRLDHPVTTSRVRLVVETALADPLVAEFGLFRDPRETPDGK